MIYLKEANREDAEKEWLFVQAVPEDENGFTNAWHGVSRDDFINKALPEIIAHSKGEMLPEGYVPATTLFLWDDLEIVGIFRIRHYLTDSLREGAGHIGYYIAPHFRGKGYGTEGLKQTLKAAAKVVPEDEIYLRVNRNNPASLHVMLNNGGRVVSEDQEKIHVRIPNLRMNQM